MPDYPQTLTHLNGVEVTLDTTFALVGLRETPKELTAAAEQRLASAGLEVAEPRAGQDKEHPPINHTPRRMWLAVRERAESVDEIRGRVERAGVSVDWVAPVYRTPGGEGPGARFAPLPNVVLVRRPRTESPRFAAAVKKLGLRQDKVRSTYLNDYDYYEISDRERTAFDVRDQLLQEFAEEGVDVRFENMPMAAPTTAVPNDTLFAQQWNMTQIGGPAAWDISTGSAGVVVAVLDQGVDQTHPDLQLVAGGGVNLGTMTPPGAPTGPHGTACAGIVAGRFNNAEGVAGVAGNCTIMPIAFQNWTDVECAAGINYAVANGARAISMSFGVYAPGDGFGPTGWDFTVIDPAIANAVASDVVLCAATGNENTSVINRYPARDPRVIAVGGTDRVDNRKAPASPDGECWGANSGPGISVAAPCVQCPTTDIQGNGGYNTNAGGPINWACVNYASSGDAAGNYIAVFDGTSAATPHVAGLAGLLRSRYPGLSAARTRDVIERTAAKVGGAYADAPGFSNGTRTNDLGYGRIDAFRAVDFADVFIRDYPGDSGVEPSTPPGGVFWANSDIVIRAADDDVFLPSNAAEADNVRRGQTNYLYVRLTNNGPADARDVVADARIAAYAGTEFSYPGDWTAVDANHVQPSPMVAAFPLIPAGTSVIAKFTISTAQVESMWNWLALGWHPCILAQVGATNDYAFATASTAGTPIITRRNNLAQRNVTVVPALTGSMLAFPFVVGSRFSEERIAELVIDRGTLPAKAKVLLELEPQEDALFAIRDADPRPAPEKRDIVFLDRTRLRLELGGVAGHLTLERGSRFAQTRAHVLDVLDLVGGEYLVRKGGRVVTLREQQTRLRVEKEPGALVPMVLRLHVPEDTQAGAAFTVTISQLDGGGNVVGGVTLVAVAEPAGMLDRVTDHVLDRLTRPLTPS